MKAFLILVTFSLLMLPGCNRPGSIIHERTITRGWSSPQLMQALGKEPAYRQVAVSPVEKSSPEVVPPHKASKSPVAPAPILLTETVTERTVVKQPTKPVSPATLTHDKVGNPQASTGATDAVDQALAQLNIWVMAGLGLVVLGIAYTIARFVFPPLAVLPLWASPALILGGLAVGAYPMLLDRYSGWVFVGVAAAVVFTGMYVASWVHNWLMSRVPRAMGKYLSPEEKKAVATATGSGILDLTEESVIPPTNTKENP